MTIIPSRVAPLAVPSPRAFLALPPDPSTPVAEKRRVLPSLIAAEPPRAEPAPTRDADDVGTRRRARVRKRSPGPTGSSIVEPNTAEPDILGALVADAEVPRPASPAPPQAPGDDHRATRPARRRATKAAALAPGERWKRRLGRWSR